MGIADEPSSQTHSESIRHAMQDCFAAKCIWKMFVPASSTPLS